MLGVLPFVEDPDLSWSAAPALPQHLPPWFQQEKVKIILTTVTTDQKQDVRECSNGNLVKPKV